MNLNELKRVLSQVEALNIVLPNGQSIPAHFHLTELGLITKHFVDCGHSIRKTQHASLQLWVANDTDHRLKPDTLIKIIDEAQSAGLFAGSNPEIEVEYQRESITKFGLEFAEGVFFLTEKFTDCLAKDNCGVPVEKQKRNLADLTPAASSCCTPGGTCC